MKTFERTAASTLARIVTMIAAAGALVMPLTLSAQTTRLQQASRKVSDFTALYEAENHKSAFCTAYVGKVVPVASFDILARTLATTGKGEFETTAQYKARLTAGAALAKRGPVVFALPTDRDEISYLADSEIMMVRASAFGAGEFSDEAEVQASALTIIPDGIPQGVTVPYSSSTRLLRTYTARNGLGNTVKVSDMERQSNALYLAAPSLFPFAKAQNSPVLGFKVPLAQAPRIKQTLRVALVAEPKAPYVFKQADSGAAATMLEPTHYEEKLTALYATPKCGLALDAQSRVLAAVDAGQ
jgi:hypothetical protein